MKKFMYNLLKSAFGKSVAKNFEGFVVLVIVTYLALC